MSKGNYKPKKKKNNKQPHVQDKQVPKHVPMKFNTIFSLALFIGAVGMAFFGIDSAIYMGIRGGLDFIVGSIILMSFCISTGIMLLKKRLSGYRLSMVYNWIQIIGALSSLAIGMLIICSKTFLVYSWYIFGYANGTFMIISSVPVIAFHIFALVYYKKRKSLFV